MEVCRAVWFTGSKMVEIKESKVILSPQEDEVTIEAVISGISSGTELKVYKGEFCSDNEKNNSVYSDSFQFPFQYGYSVVGRIIEKGSKVKNLKINQLVFVFHSHEEKFIVKEDEVNPIPEGISAEDAVFFSNVETAINFVHDGRPMLGETISVFGQGIVGLLTTYLLTQIPFAKVFTFDLFEKRREASKRLGATDSFDPNKVDVSGVIQNGADLSFEISGSPLALAEAVKATGYHGRVILGSWYGCHPLYFGNSFHRSHISIVASQVSNIRPELTGRWTKERRFDVVWEVIQKLKPSQFITHVIPFQEAAKAYSLLDNHPEETIQVVLSYKKQPRCN